MAKKAELIKVCMYRILRLELALEKEPDSNEIKKLLEEEKAILEEIKKAN